MSTGERAGAAQVLIGRLLSWLASLTTLWYRTLIFVETNGTGTLTAEEVSNNQYTMSQKKGAFFVRTLSNFHQF